MTEWKLSSVDFVNFPFFWDVSIRNSLRSNNFVREPHRYLDLNRRQFSFRHPHSIRENIFLSSGIFLVRLTYPFLSRTSKYFVLEVYISGMGVRVEWFVSIITSSKYAIKREMLVERGKFRTTEKYFLEWSVDDGMKTVFGWGLVTGVVLAQNYSSEASS